ncbi:trypsin-like peptidase domain-containing protein [Ensifer aridi]|uniref:trypsin-like peptidase domain-containing protein n=1 Tax=Ensifer aridi TaxID=1708715 RepID=UPI000A10BCDE|nr:trypsin-like peptidase domain-containing protein [Ensifer aridi]
MEYDPAVLTRIVLEILEREAANGRVGRAPDDLEHTVRPSAAAVEGRPAPQTDIPFVEDVVPADRPFSDVGAKGGVDDPAKMLRGWTGAPDSGLVLETAVGRYLTSPSALLSVLADRRRAVAIVSAEGTDYRGDVGRWSGTGFVVAPNLFLTNHHVLNSVQVARTAKIEFNYEISPENLLVGNGAPPRATQSFSLDPTRLFVTSPTINGLDYTFVWIEGAAQAAFGSIPMERSSFTVDEGAQAFVIHHPDGRPKEVSLDDTDIIGIKTTIIHYSSDTMGGSSGAPVFDHRGRLIALHHASRRQTVELPDGGRTDVVNEGIKIAAIAIDLENKMRSSAPDASQAEAVLREIGGSDTMSGFFGGLGREIAPDRVAPEAVVDTYRGTDQDIDIGFWNIEWLATRWRDDKKLNGAARVIADLNLDAWGLSEISPPGVRALVERIEEIYGDRYECEFSEPDAPEGKQSTAMIWKKSSLVGETATWPSNVEPLFRSRSDDPAIGPEAVHGMIFDRYPGLFRFKTAGDMAPYTFYVVPLHLKAMDEGSLRRRLASRILARAVEDLSGETGHDVILGGDMNAPLASDDFKHIERAGFTILGAQDEREGAFTYLKSPRSAIDNVFLSPGMRQSVGSVDYFIVAKDRSLSDFVDRVSDHRPIAMRLSLGRTHGSAIPEVGDLDALIEELLAQQKAKNTRKRITRRRTT